MTYSGERVTELLSASRVAPYLRSAEDNRDDALELYVWSTRMAMSMFELLSHLEVMLRNAMDVTLSSHYRDAACGIPWFLRNPPTTVLMAEAVAGVRDRLRPQGRDDRDQIIAGMSFGFWVGMVGVKHDDLWRKTLYRAFPGSGGNRKDVMKEMEAVRKLRNRLAHHDSMLNVDVPFEVRRMHRLAGFLGTDAAAWLKHVDQTSAVYQIRPHSAVDTVVVPAGRAWDLYQGERAYVCQAGRTFKSVDRMAFYTERSIQPEIPWIKCRRDDVVWTEKEAARLENSSDREDRQIARVIRASRRTHWTEGVYQVFLLTEPGDHRHRTLPAAIPNSNSGRGSAFVRAQRYVSLHRLETSATTDDLV